MGSGHDAGACLTPSPTRAGNLINNDPVAIANRWIAAYNARDFDTLRTLITEDIHIEHHNRGVVFDGPDAMFAVLAQFGALLSDRRFQAVRRQFAASDTAVAELTREGTPPADIEGFAKKGETVRLELACLWTIRASRAAAYHD